MRCAVAIALFVCGFGCLVEAVAAQDGGPPNIVLINADDVGYGDLSCYGATKVRTPRIDSLARDGRRFTDAHSASAVCSPSRYGLLTGCYPHRRNLWGPVPVREPLTIDVERTTLASLLRGAGYATACLGKWHLGFGEDEPDWNGELAPGPLELGFGHFYGIPTVNSGAPFVWVEDRRVVGLDPDDPFVYGQPSVTRRMPEKGGYRVIGGAEAAHRLYVDELVGTTLAARAVDWIRKQDGERPFFLYLATTNIHHPCTPHERFRDTSDCGAYGDFLHELDWIVGEVLDALDAGGIADDTLVVFTSDNGGMFHVTGQRAFAAGHRSNGDLLGYKFGAWEGGHRVPMIVRWPGQVPPGTVSDHLIGHVDLLATFAAIVGGDPGDDHDSIDQLETLVGSPGRPLRDTLVIAPNSPKHLAVRHGRWMFIPAQGAGGFQGKEPGEHLYSDVAALPFVGRTNSDVVDGRIADDAPPAQLYDLVADPGQARNVYREHPEVVAELAAILERERERIPESRRIGWINLKQ